MWINSLENPPDAPAPDGCCGPLTARNQNPKNDLEILTKPNLYENNIFILIFPGAFPSEFLFQHVNDRTSRIQSKSSISGFVEAQPIMERSSMIARSQ